MASIYLIKNNVTNAIYVGSTTTSFKKRITGHRSLLKRNKHHSKYLQRSWNKHKESSFSFILLEECSNEEVLQREQYYIDTLLPEYNSVPYATPGSSKSSEETKKKISAALMGKKKSPEHIAAVVAANKLVKNRKKRSIESYVGQSKQVIAINKKTKEIAEFRSATYASKALGVRKKSVFESMTKRWSAEDFVFIEKSKFDKNKPIEVYIFKYVLSDSYNTYYFNSLKEIGKFFSVSETEAFRMIKKRFFTRDNNTFEGRKL